MFWWFFLNSQHFFSYFPTTIANRWRPSVGIHELQRFKRRPVDDSFIIRPITYSAKDQTSTIDLCLMQTPSPCAEIPSTLSFYNRRRNVFFAKIAWYRKICVTYAERSYFLQCDVFFQFSQFPGTPEFFQPLFHIS